MASSVDNWSDSEIRTKLAELGTPVGPVTETTRKILIKKLKRLLQLANSPSKRGSLARYSSGDETQEETNMPPPAVKMRNRRKTTGSAELKTAIADSSVNADVSGRSESDRTFRERKSFASSSTILKTYDTDSDSDIVEGSRLRKSKRFVTSVSDRSPQLNSSRQSPKIEPAKPWRERTPDLVLPTVQSKTIQNRSKHSPTLFDEREDEGEEEEEEEEEEETEEEGDRPYQSDLLRRLTTGGRFSSSYVATDSPKREPYGSSSYSSLYSSNRPSDNYKIFSSRHETVNSYADKDKYSYLTSRNPITPSKNIYGTKSSFQSVWASLYNINNRKLILGCAAIFIFLLAAYIFLSISTRVYLIASDSDAHKYPLCGSEGHESPLCVSSKHLESTLELSKVLIPWILDLTTKSYCESPAGDIIERPTMSEDDAIKYLSSKGRTPRSSLERDLRNLKILLLTDPEWEIEVVGKPSDDIQSILFNGKFAARSVILPVSCKLKQVAFSTLKYMLYLTLICGTGFLVVFGFRMYKLRQEQHKQEVYKMVNKILNLLCSRHEQNIYPGYVAVNNCRDELIQPIERDAKRNVWQDAVDFIEKHESRVRAEMHSVRGESVKVWRWLPAGGPPISPNSSADGPVLGRLM